ncbi:MAG TPA: c-type cytochrome [Planctomycetaceae bacterium]|nr:c-type cytochrome [Planctomycetaceae bacterium]
MQHLETISRQIPEPRGMRLHCLFPVLSSLLSVLIFYSASALAQQGDEDSFALGVRNTEPVSAAEELATFRVPDGFRVELVAAEPDIAKPMNLAFDAKGWLWVSSSLEYPFAAAPDVTPRDTIRVLEDKDGDGKADSAIVFADKLNIPIGLIPYGDGVICFSIPNIWFLHDKDGDGKCDERQVLYGPFDTSRDTHGMCNAFRRGDDGWIYACHGFNNRSDVAGSDGYRVQMSSGSTFRFRPDGSRIELYTQGQVNPFGMSIDRFGDIYTADCHTKPVTLLLPGGCYDSFGRPHDGLGYVPSVMEHLHGSTAIAALALGSDTNFPVEYADTTFDGNVMTSRINRNVLQRTGSSVRAVEQPDFMSSSDPWFRPVDIVAGPDGALYVADFYNRIIGHYEVPLMHPGRDRFRGRIWRVTYGSSPRTFTGYGLDLTMLTVPQLIDVMRTAPTAQKHLARDVLADRQDADVDIALRAYAADANAVVRQYVLRLRAQRNSLAADDIAAAASDPDELVRVHAFRALRELSVDAISQEDSSRILRRGFGDLSAMVRRAAVAAASRHLSYDLTAPLLRMLHTTDLADVHLRHSIRIALRDHLQNEDWFRDLTAQSPLIMDRLALADLSLALKTPAAAEYIAANVEFLGAAQPEKLAEYLQFAAAYVTPDAAAGVVSTVRKRFAADQSVQLQLLTSMRQGFAQRGQVPPDSVREWALEAALNLLSMKSPQDLQALEGKAPFSWSYVPHPDSPNPGNCWGISESRMSSDGVVGAPLFSSFEQGEQRTGLYRSDNFEPSAVLSFYVAGHDGFPDKPLKKVNFVRLRDAATGEILREAAPPRNDVAQKTEWSTQEFQGRKVFVELVDGDAGTAYAWLAVGRFSDDRLNPSSDQLRRLQAASLIGDFALGEMRPALVQLIGNAESPRATRAAFASALLKLKADSRLAAIAIIPFIAGATDVLINDAMAAIANDLPDTAEKILETAFQVATSAEQLTLAEQLTTDVTGVEVLLRLMESGKASARLLLKPTVLQRMQAIATDGIMQRATHLTANLPSEDAVIEQLIAARRNFLNAASGDPAAGKELFKKSCLICHQLAGEGKQVGPNLDAIGNRGMDRLLEDVLAPNRNVDVAFRTTTVVTDEGKAYSGLLKELEGNRVSIIDSQAKETILQTDTIEERKAATTSPMPSNVSETFTETQLRDLMTFLLQQRKK